MGEAKVAQIHHRCCLGIRCLASSPLLVFHWYSLLELASSSSSSFVVAYDFHCVIILLI